MANESTNRHRNQSNAFKLEMSLRQVAEEKRKEAWIVSKGKKDRLSFLVVWGTFQ